MSAPVLFTRVICAFVILVPFNWCPIAGAGWVRRMRGVA
jgi:hypothetical protein